MTTEKSMTLQEQIRDGMDLTLRIVEIGPLYRPFVRKSEGNVIYVDHADTATLRGKYKDDTKFNTDDIVDVDAVWGAKTLSECIGDPASYIIASHVIEHVPDLLTWLSELTDALAEGGQIRLVIPDKRFTFDYLRRTTAFADILDAHLRKTRTPLPRCILDHVLNVRNVDMWQAWCNDELDACDLERPQWHGYDLAVGTAEKSLRGEYHDVHCWVFTPRVFCDLMREAAEHGLISLRCERFHDTAMLTLEFVAFLEPCNDQAQVIRSWEEAASRCVERPPAEVIRLNREIEVQRRENDRQSAEIARQSDEIASLRHNAAHLRGVIAAYENSTSWRITAPARWAVERLMAMFSAATRSR